MELDDCLVSEQNPKVIMYDSKILLNISYICGISALVVGWGIFILWAILLAISGKPFEPLMIAGLFWIAIGGIIGIVGLICLVAFAVINRAKRQPNSVKSAAVLLANIPSVFLIIYFVTLTGHL